MKWSITQLKKNQNEPFTFDKEIDMNYLTDRVEELIDISPIKVTGDAQVRMHEIIVNLDISGVLTLPCARTLKPVELPFDTTSVEIFELDEFSESNDEDDDDLRHKLEGGMINLLPIIEELVILEKPLQVFSEESENISMAGNGWEVIGEDQFESTDDSVEETEKSVDPRLQKLQQFFDDEK